MVIKVGSFRRAGYGVDMDTKADEQDRSASTVSAALVVSFSATRESKSSQAGMGNANNGQH